MKEKKERFIELLRSTGRQGIEEVINYLEKSGFFTAPASTKHHLNYEGGLMEHSLNVYDMAMAMRGPIMAMKPDMEERLPKKSIIIAALLHDTCKANIYKKTKKWDFAKDGTPEQKEKYTTNYSEMPVGHGEKSVILLLQNGFKLTNDEALAGLTNQHRQIFTVVDVLYEKIVFCSLVRRTLDNMSQRCFTTFCGFNIQTVVADETEYLTVAIDAIVSEHLFDSDFAGIRTLINDILNKVFIACHSRFCFVVSVACFFYSWRNITMLYVLVKNTMGGILMMSIHRRNTQ